MARNYDVLALGNAIVDVIAPVGDEFLLKHNIAKGIMTLVDEYRAHQLYQAFGERRESAGGSAANTTVGLASLGAKALFVGKVKEDRLGESFSESLKGMGVAYKTPRAADGAPTASCLIAVAGDGQRSMNTHLGAARSLSPEDIKEDDIAAADIVYVEGYLWDAESARAAAQKAMTLAKKHDTRIAFTLSDPFCVGRYREDFLALLENDLDVVFANEEEALALFEAANFDEVLQHAARWGGIAALTRSAKGCVAVGEGEVHVVDAAPVERVVDTTGAGDQFAAGFLYGLVRGKNLGACGRLGALAAGEVISHFGARPEVSLEALAAKAALL